MIYNWLKSAQNLFYPPCCLLCGGPGQGKLDICAGCFRELPHNHHCCPVCALPLPATAGSGLSCGRCLDHPPRFDRCYAPFLYLPPVERLISDLKFRDGLTQGRLLAMLLGDYLKQTLRQPPELIIPVPLHPSRLRERGYNQSLELARPLSRQLGIPLDYRRCSRPRATPHQVSLRRKDRTANVRGCFAVANPMGARHVALVDDVVTTGATVSELAGLLRRRGVESVEIWAVARTP